MCWLTVLATRAELFSLKPCCPLTLTTISETNALKKRHFVPNRYIYLNQSDIEATQDIYLLQSEFVVAKHDLLLFQIVPITLNGIICFK